LLLWCVFRRREQSFPSVARAAWGTNVFNASAANSQHHHIAPMCAGDEHGCMLPSLTCGVAAAAAGDLGEPLAALARLEEEGGLRGDEDSRLRPLLVSILHVLLVYTLLPVCPWLPPLRIAPGGCTGTPASPSATSASVIMRRHSVDTSASERAAVATCPVASL